MEILPEVWLAESQNMGEKLSWDSSSTDQYVNEF